MVRINNVKGTTQIVKVVVHGNRRRKRQARAPRTAPRAAPQPLWPQHIVTRVEPMVGPDQLRQMIQPLETRLQQLLEKNARTEEPMVAQAAQEPMPLLSQPMISTTSQPMLPTPKAMLSPMASRIPVKKNTISLDSLNDDYIGGHTPLSSPRMPGTSPAKPAEPSLSSLLSSLTVKSSKEAGSRSLTDIARMANIPLSQTARQNKSSVISELLKHGEKVRAVLNEQ